MLIVFLILALLIEIVTFIEIGAVIGAWWTIFLVILTAAIGLKALRKQGYDTFMNFQKGLIHANVLTFTLFENFVIFVGGVLLVVPGFITDMLGCLCLLRPSRVWMIKLMLRYGLELADNAPTIHKNPRGGRDIEGTFRRRDDHD